MEKYERQGAQPVRILGSMRGNLFCLLGLKWEAGIYSRKEALFCFSTFIRDSKENAWFFFFLILLEGSTFFL